MNDGFAPWTCDSFDVVRVDARADGTWVLRGRALRSIRPGDVLTTQRARAVVTGIETYGRSTDLLSELMTGTLVVSLEAEG